MSDSIGIPVAYYDLDGDLVTDDVHNNEDERWLPVNGHETYKVSDPGRIKNKTGRIFRASQVHQKYIYVILDGKSHALHRLVAFHFVPNDDPEHKIEVDHRDRDKTNNAASNLTWCTHAENMAWHRERVQIIRKSRPCLVRLRKQTDNDWIEFPSKNVAAEHYGVSPSALTHKESRYLFRWVDDVRYSDEEFRQLPGNEPYCLYQITKSGKMNRIGDNGFVSGTYDHSGYLKMKLCWNNKVINLTAHQLVMLAWGPPKPTDKHEINHKNGIRDDNRLENLEWSTHPENSQHAHDIGLVSKNQKGRLTYKYELDGTFLEELDQAGDNVAAFLFHIKQEESGRVQYDGYLWSYEKVAKLETNKFEAIRYTFPDYDPVKHRDINFDLIRPYIRNGRQQPISHFDVDGTLIKIYDHINEAGRNINPDNTAWSDFSKYFKKLETPKLHYFGYIRRATIDDVIEPKVRDERLFENSCDVLVKMAQKDMKPEDIDWSFVRHVLNDTDSKCHSLTRPVLQSDGNGKPIRRWRSLKDAELSLMTTPTSQRPCIQQILKRFEKGKRSDTKFLGYSWSYTTYEQMDIPTANCRCTIKDQVN